MPSVAPFARGPTEDEIQDWMGSFELLKPPKGNRIEVGHVVLWRGYKKGSSGGDSTKEEFFRGVVHRIIQDEGDGKRYVVS